MELDQWEGRREDRSVVGGGKRTLGEFFFWLHWEEGFGGKSS